MPPYFRVVEVSACTNGWKISVELVRRDADAGVRDLEAHDGVIAVGCSAAVDPDARLRRPRVNLIALPIRLISDLPHPAGIAADDRGHASCSTTATSSRPLACAEPASRSTTSSTIRAQAELDVLDLELAGLDLREVEDVVDDRQQRLAGVADRLRVVALAGVEVGLEQQIGHADDAVHRRADLVAHVGEEVGLEARRLVRLVARALDSAASAPVSAVTSASVPTQPAMPPSVPGIDFEMTSTIRDAESGTWISKRRLTSPS